MTFGAATNSKTFDDAEYDGILGLGFPSPQIRSLLDYLKLAERHFSIKLNRDRSKGGELIIGGVDGYTGNMRFFRVTANYWQLRMVAVSLPMVNFKLCAAGCDVIVNSGSSLISGPRKELHELHEKVFKAMHNKDFDRYFVHCPTVDHLPSISFMMKDKEHRYVTYSLKPRDYVQRLEVCAMCMRRLFMKCHSSNLFFVRTEQARSYMCN